VVTKAREKIRRKKGYGVKGYVNDNKGSKCQDDVQRCIVSQ
jgi:hypothetical protein